MKKNIFIIVTLILTLFALIFVIQRTSRHQPLVAFVIDDWGYNIKNIDTVFQIQRPLTISILPNLLYSKEIAERFRENGGIYDIILHLPLEPKSNRAVERNTIRCNMKKDKMLSILGKDIESVPGIVGVSNHQGSKATENERVMKIIFSELKKRELYFLDNLTTPKSVCSRIAKNTGIKFAERNVFLDITDQTDLENFESYIKKQIRELADIAMKRGSAIGVGHSIEPTLKIIKEMVPELEKQGIKIVLLKELVR